MRLRIDSLSLVGTSRRVELEPGFNLIVGPISTGKTTAIRLIRALLGGDAGGMPPEVQRLSTAVGGELVLGSEAFSIIRPLVSTPSARVDIAGQHASERLPVSRTSLTDSQSYKDWLLASLGLPRIEVPSAPSRLESEPTPVTISDYLMYCVLGQHEIDESVFGHMDAFKNIKRKYVFQILYGLYNVAMAELQEQLRDVDAEIRQLHAQRAAFAQVLEGTPWENRATLVLQLDGARAKLAALEEAAVTEVTDATASEPRIAVLLATAREIDVRIAELAAESESETRAAIRLEDLSEQLRAQSAKLTRSIVADSLFAEIDFVVCPRCGSSIQSSRGDEHTCCLCLQAPETPPSRDDLISEQNRIEAQIGETIELTASHRTRVSMLARELERLRQERRVLGDELDYVAATFVSDSAEHLKSVASERAQLAEQAKRLDDYLSLFDRLDDLAQSAAALEERRVELQSRIEAESDKEGMFTARVDTLERNLRWALGKIGLPEFVDAESATIDRTTFLPLLNGRTFSQLSSPGLKLIVNVAHAVAHHKTAIELGLSLPGLLVLDGLGSHLGHEGFDLERLQSLYALLREFSAEHADEMQVIVADNDEMAGYSEYVRLRLGDQDRLVPTNPLIDEALQNETNQP